MVTDDTNGMHHLDHVRDPPGRRQGEKLSDPSDIDTALVRHIPGIGHDGGVHGSQRLMACPVRPDSRAASSTATVSSTSSMSTGTLPPSSAITTPR